MAEIINIKNEAGEVQYPVTKPECVIDENGKNVLQLIRENAGGDPYDDTELRQEVAELSATLDNKQEQLVSGENIKTINGESILGKGNIVIEGKNYDNEIAARNVGAVDVEGGAEAPDAPSGGGYDDTEIREELAQLSEDIYEKRIEVVPCTYLDGYYAGNGVIGTYRDDSTRSCTKRFKVVEGETYYLSTIIGTSTAIGYLVEWDAQDNGSVPNDYKGGSLKTIEDAEYIVPSGVEYIAVSSYNTTKPIVKKLAISDEVKFYTKDEVYTKLEVKDLLPSSATGAKIYGVKNDLSNPTNVEWERTHNSIGLSSYSQNGTDGIIGTDDFMDVYPFNSIRECNIFKLPSGATKIIYKGEDGFSLENDTFVEFPLWYERRYIKDGYEHREICDQQVGGFYPSPMFVESGRVLDKVYIAKYETSQDVDGNARSVSGEVPLTYKTLDEFRNLTRAKGKGFACMDIRTIFSLQHLYLVRFANKNSQDLIGDGYTGLYQPWGFGSKDYSGATSGEVMVKNYVKSYPSPSLVQDIQKKYWVGQTIGFVKSDERAMYDHATITDMVVSDDKKQITIYFDKDVEIITEAVNASVSNSDTPVRTWFGGHGQRTGNTDAIMHDTGCGDLWVASNRGTSGVKLFHLENLWGNVWHELDGLVFINEYAFIGMSQEEYNTEGNGYIPLAHAMLQQAELGSVGSQFCFIGNLWLDNAFPWVAYPNEVRGGSPTDTTMPSQGITQNNSYGDAYYFDKDDNKGYSLEAHGGGFDHYERAGLFCHRCWNGLESKWYLQGSRMQFKNL